MVSTHSSDWRVNYFILCVDFLLTLSRQRLHICFPKSVAVTGLPEPQANHAIIMARFAWECLVKMNAVTKELEVSLGCVAYAFSWW